MCLRPRVRRRLHGLLNWFASILEVRARLAAVVKAVRTASHAGCCVVFALVRTELQWWQQCLARWNRHAVVMQLKWLRAPSPRDACVPQTDASRYFGGGGAGALAARRVEHVEAKGGLEPLRQPRAARAIKVAQHERVLARRPDGHRARPGLESCRDQLMRGHRRGRWPPTPRAWPQPASVRWRRGKAPHRLPKVVQDSGQMVGGHLSAA